MASHAPLSNNPYAVLERTWREISKTNGVVEGDAVPREESQAGALNLSAVCMSNIMMLEDKHLPSVIVRMYEFCLERSVNGTTEDTENEARLRLLNFIIHRWHETREKLMFIRDAARILAALSRSVVGDHLSIAVEATAVSQQHVMRELMRTIRRESRGMTLGAFLERYSTAPSSEFLFHDMTFELFDRDDVYDYDRASRGGLMESYVGEILRAPVMHYLKRVLISMIRAFCNLKLHIPNSVSERLFSESVPSWVEEDTETGLLRMDNASRERLQLARENISVLLMQRRDKPKKRAAVTGPVTPTEAHARPRAQPTQPLEDEFVDTRTVDTASFLGEPPQHNIVFQTPSKPKRARTTETTPAQAAQAAQAVQDDSTLVRLCDTERDLLDQITSRISGNQEINVALEEEEDRVSTISSIDTRESLPPPATIRSFVRTDQDLSALAEHDRQEDRLIESVVAQVSREPSPPQSVAEAETVGDVHLDDTVLVISDQVVELDNFDLSYL